MNDAVDESVHAFINDRVRVVPHVLGSGLRMLPVGMHAELTRAECVPLCDGSVFLRYTRR